MVRHVVMWKLKDEAEARARQRTPKMARMLEGLVGKIAAFSSSRWGSTGGG